MRTIAKVCKSILVETLELTQSGDTLTFQSEKAVSLDIDRQLTI